MANDRRRRFEALALPHMDAAYNLARWLSGGGAEAEDLVQEAYLRAWRYFDAFRGDDMRVWLLTIVRNCFMSWARSARPGRMIYSADVPEDDAEPLWTAGEPDPEALLLSEADAVRVNQVMAELPLEQREVLLLREVEELSYQEIATVIGVPVGTVMSRLSRARASLRQRWFEGGRDE